MATITFIESNQLVGDKDPILTLFFGSTNFHTFNPVQYPVTAAALGVSFEKYIRAQVTIGDSSSVDNLRLWLSSYNVVTALVPRTSATTTSYSAESFVVPVEATTLTPHTTPIALPDNPNMGIAGLLTSSFTGDGDSDFSIQACEVLATALTGPADGTWQMRITWDEVN